jgi:hypothetical protein
MALAAYAGLLVFSARRINFWILERYFFLAVASITHHP